MRDFFKSLFRFIIFLHICTSTMKNLLITLAAFVLISAVGCTEGDTKKAPSTVKEAAKKDTTTSAKTAAGPVADAKTILARTEVPVLCYHHIRGLRGRETSRMLEYIVPEQNFKDQMQSLADSGYHTITPDEYEAYLATGAPLPSKPIMITYDDTDLEQYTVALPEMEKHGFKGVYFIMTISIGRPRYMSKEQIKDLSDKGHVIASHTWDHHNVKTYTDADWDVQFLKTREKLETITGKPVRHFAYPFGLWNSAAIPELKKRGYASAYQLSERTRDSTAPLYSLRRMIVPGNWTTKTMHKYISGTFRAPKPQG
jgi:peptidoglycan/xylan/chitin deacetylase (PgdA/CDA1 family)